MSARDIQRGRPGKVKAKKADRMNVRPAKEAHAPLRPNERHGDLRLLVDFEAALENGTRLLNGATETLERLRDASGGQPPSQSYEGNSGGQSGVLWCDVHQSDRCTEPNTAGDEVQCRDLISHFARPDRVGEAAVRPDAARDDERTMTDAMRRTIVAIEAATVVASAWSGTRTPTPGERDRAAEANRRWCQAHLAATNPNNGQPYKVEPIRQAPSNCGGRLATSMRLCRWCETFVTRTEDSADGPRVPNAEEIVIHESGGKVHVHAGKVA